MGGSQPTRSDPFRIRTDRATDERDPEIRAIKIGLRALLAQDGQEFHNADVTNLIGMPGPNVSNIFNLHHDRVPYSPERLEEIKTELANALQARDGDSTKVKAFNALFDQLIAKVASKHPRPARLR